MITGYVEMFRDYKGDYSEKVSARMRHFRNNITNGIPGVEHEIQGDPVAGYDYDTYCLKKRINGTVFGLAEARKKLSDLLKTEEIDALFAVSNSLVMKGGYNYCVDRINTVAVGAAIWILDELMLSGKLDEIYQYLPDIDEDKYDETVYIPLNHPVYSEDLIFALVYLIRHRNHSASIGDKGIGTLIWKQDGPDTDEESLKYRSAFDSVLALLNPESVKKATQLFEEKVWEFYRIAFSIMRDVEKRIKTLEEEQKKIQQHISGNIADAIKPKNVLFMPNFSNNVASDEFSGQRDFERTQTENNRLENEINSLNLITFSSISLPNDREKLVKSLKGVISEELTEKALEFHVDDPFETAFALLYLMDTKSRVPWFYYGSISVAYTMCDQMPYDIRTKLPEKTIQLTDWNSALYQHRYKGYRFDDAKDSEGEPVMREFAKNLSQIIFTNSLTLVPRVVPEQVNLAAFLNDLGELSEHEKEAYSLLSYVLLAGQLKTRSFIEYKAVSEVERFLEENSKDEVVSEETDGNDQLREENSNLREKNKKLIEMMNSILSAQKNDSKQVALLQKQINLQEKELSDLREAVYLLENESSTENEVPTDETIQYPFDTTGKIVSFGGHENWLKEMRKKLPGVTFVAPGTIPNTDLIRSADTVWLQTNCISHSDFFRIIGIVRQNGIPLRYFSFGGPDKCAEQLVKSVK